MGCDPQSDNRCMQRNCRGAWGAGDDFLIINQAMCLPQGRLAAARCRKMKHYEKNNNYINIMLRCSNG